MKAFKNHAPEDSGMAMLKVGKEGAIRLPAEVCQVFDIEPGEELLVLADEEKGIAIAKPGFFAKMGVKATQGKVPEGKDMALVRLGADCTLVLPEEMREMLDIRAGESLLLLADKKRGIALVGVDEAEDPDA